MSKSIIQKNKECYITHSTYNLHKHHIFEGTANRQLSEKYRTMGMVKSRLAQYV
mgnify:CR=1 FL=1